MICDSGEIKTAVALGLFDGVHKGHRAVIGEAVRTAEKEKLAPAVFTFDIESLSYKGGGGLIAARGKKHEEIYSLGIKKIYSPDFESIKNLSAEEFVTEILCGKLSARYAVCGEDFRFGKNASGDVKTLENICGKHGIKVKTVPPVISEDGEKISSTRIRELIAEGNIQAANRLLGYDYSLKAPVAYGNQIGRTINFPTVNQYFPEKLILPKFGVYSSEVRFDGKKYGGITNVGTKPTVTDKKIPIAETYIKNFDGDLYGKTVEISLRDFIRPERKFSGIEELKRQIEIDISKSEVL